MAGERLHAFKGEVLTDEQIQARAHTLLLAKYARELGLFKRIPELFRRRGWPMDQDSMAVALAAVCHMKAGLLDQRIEIPATVRGIAPWDELGNIHDVGAIVADLDLGDLLDP